MGLLSPQELPVSLPELLRHPTLRMAHRATALQGVGVVDMHGALQLLAAPAEHAAQGPLAQAGLSVLECRRLLRVLAVMRGAYRWASAEACCADLTRVVDYCCAIVAEQAGQSVGALQCRCMARALLERCQVLAAAMRQSAGRDSGSTLRDPSF